MALDWEEKKLVFVLNGARTARVIGESESYPIGWYFVDEAESLHGPFRMKREALMALRDYCESL